MSSTQENTDAGSCGGDEFILASDKATTDVRARVRKSLLGLAERVEKDDPEQAAELKQILGN